MFPSNQNLKFQLASKYHGVQHNMWLALAGTKEGNVVDLGEGYPDYMPSPDIVANLAEVCRPEANNLIHQYTRAFGHERLVKALANLYGPLIGRGIDPFNEVVITGGATGAIYYTLMANINPGDEVIIIEPSFDCYENMVRLAGGNPVFIPLLPDESAYSSGVATSANTWKLNTQNLRELFNANTKAILLNTPNNPVGKVFSRQELLEIGGLCREFNTIIISDEVYEWIIYDGNEHIRIAGLEDFWERTITIGSTAKAFGLTGWKIGWAYGPANLIYNLQVAHQNCTYLLQTPEQEALAITIEKEIKLLGTPESYFARIIRDLKPKRNRILDSVKSIGMIPIIPEAGYFVLVNWRPLESKIDLSKEDVKEDDHKFVCWLSREKRLVAIPPSMFYSEDHKELGVNYIRLNFFKKDETLAEADKILATLK